MTDFIIKTCGDCGHTRVYPNAGYARRIDAHSCRLPLCHECGKEIPNITGRTAREHRRRTKCNDCIDTQRISQSRANAERLKSERANSDDIDEVVIDRAMNGQRVQTTKAERLEIIRLWKEAGRTFNELERIQRWNVRRELRKAA